MNVSKIQFSEMVNGFKTGIFATLNEKRGTDQRGKKSV